MFELPLAGLETSVPSLGSPRFVPLRPFWIRVHSCPFLRLDAAGDVE
jgi:hypothetical protein